MIGTSLSPMALPRSRTLTDALVARSEAQLTAAEVTGLRDELEPALAETAGRLGPGVGVRVDAYRLRFPAVADKGTGRFEWSSRTARRPLALEGLRACLANPRLAPAQAIADTMARLVRTTPDRVGSLGDWLAGLSLGARSVVQAEAVTWATQLAGAIDWRRLDRPFIGHDRSLSFTTSPQIVLRGRIEVGALVAGSPQRQEVGYSATALFLVMTGRPAPTARDELGLAALTVALDPRPQLPIRVVGWWPQCGRALVLPVDERVLRRAVDAVLESLEQATSHRRDQAVARCDG